MFLRVERLAKKKRSYECEVLLRKEMARDDVLAKREELLLALGEQRETNSLAMVFRREPWNKSDRNGTVEDTEALLMQLMDIPEDNDVDVVLHVPDGLNVGAEMLADALWSHPGDVTVIVPFYAYSGTTLAALAADEIMLDPHAKLGPLVPYIDGYPADRLVAAASKKDSDWADDVTLQMAELAMTQVKALIVELLEDKTTKRRARGLAKHLVGGDKTPARPLDLAVAQKYGLPVCEGVPDVVYELMQSYRFGECARPGLDFGNAW